MSEQTFASGLTAAYNTKWSFINSFTVDLKFSSYISNVLNINGSLLNLNVKSFDTPSFVNQPIEVYVGDRWKIHNGRNELWKFTITFRDQDQLNLYKNFLRAYAAQKDRYFNEIKMGITLYKEPDHANEQQTVLFEFDDCMIDSVSQMQFSNETESQIAEFGVEFKTIKPAIAGYDLAK